MTIRTALSRQLSRPRSRSLARGLAGATLAAGLAAAAVAQQAAPAPASVPVASAAQATPAQAGPLLNIRQIHDAVEAAGYRELREIEWDDGRYEVEGRNAQGARVKLVVDSRTGAVLRERVKR